MSTFIDSEIAIYDEKKNRNDESSLNFEETRTHSFIDSLILISLSVVSLRCWRLVTKEICDNVIYKVIYIKSICKSNERLIVEKQIRNEQHFYRFERCSVDTLSINLRFFFSIFVVTYNFYSWITLLRLFEHIFRDASIMIEYNFRDISISCFR